MEIDEITKIREEKLKFLEEKGVNPYYNGEKPDITIAEFFKSYDEQVPEGPTHKVAGRIILMRMHGKAAFANIKDMSGTVQIYVRQDAVGPEAYEIFKKADIGDIVCVTGHLFKTHKGEVTVQVKKFQMLTKSLLPLPEKWHGITDIELRQRKRYLDLLMNDDVKDIFVKRTKVINQIRNFLAAKGFLEVETPMMQTIPGGAAARPFKSYHNALDMELYFRIAPELFLKRLLVGGFEKVFELNRNFRNEGISTKHNPEFTMLELYAAYNDYLDMMDMTEAIIADVLENVIGKRALEYQGQTIDFSMPFKRAELSQINRETVGADYDKKIEHYAKTAKESKYSKYAANEKNSRLLADILLFEHEVEEKIIQPTFVYNYPSLISPLARRNDANPDYSDRFELYIAGFEVANAYSELNNPLVQEQNFQEQEKNRASGDLEANMMDMDYIEALRIGMPPAGGLGIGIDRLMMLLTDQTSIREVILFPLLKPEAKEPLPAQE